MGSIRLAVGAEWLFEGRTFRAVRQLGPQQFIAEDLKFRLERQFSETEILSAFAAGTLRFAIPDEQHQERTVANSSVALDPLALEIAEIRWQAIEPLTSLGRDPQLSEFATRATALATDGVRCSSRTLQRWFRRWKQGGNDRRALAPRTSSGSNRGRKRKSSLLARFPIIRQFVEQAIREIYLTPARRPISAVARRVLEDMQRHNSRISASQALPVPRYGSLARTIARLLRQLDPYEIDRARWGRRIADQRHRATTRQRMATRILERVEIDHSPLKVVVGTESGPIGQPWLTVLVDYYSRMILGFCLGFEPPSYAVLMEALRQAILPKTYVRAKYPQIANDWPCYGVPEKLVCDRGADLISKDLEQAAFQLGMELDFMPPRTPHLKGTVESFFDTLNDQLISILPGRTFRSWEKRADYQPDDGPLMPYETLVEVIHRHLIEIHAQQKHPTSAKTRYEMWQESATEFSPAIPSAPEDLVVLLARTVERSLSVRGIELYGMFYASDELFALRSELAAANLPFDKLTVRYNPWDLGSVWIVNPVTRRYLQALAVDAAMNGLTEYQWRVLRRAVRERFDDPDHLLSLAAARNAIRDVVASTLKKHSRRRRSRAARYTGDFQGLGHDPEAPDLEDTEAAEPVAEVPPPSDEPPPEANADVTRLPDLDVDDWDVVC